MQDIQILHTCLFDETYKNKVLFQIELQKVKDTKLIIGVLTDLALKKEWGADYKSIVDLIAQYLPQANKEVMIECNEYFKQQWNEFRNSMNVPKVATLNNIIEMVNLLKNNTVVKIEDNTEFVSRLKELTHEEVEYFKSMLLEVESYEAVSLIDKILS